jgi:hypothetical protein
MAFPMGVFLETLKDDRSELHVHKMCLSLAYHQLRISLDNPGGCKSYHSYSINASSKQMTQSILLRFNPS